MPAQGDTLIYSGAQLLDEVLFRGSEMQTAGDRSSDFAIQALNYINRVYAQICVGGGELVPNMHEDWWWLYKRPPGILILNPEFRDGGITLVNGSADAVFTSPPAFSVQDRFLKVHGHWDFPRIGQHVEGQVACVLDAPYTGPSVVGQSFDCFQLEYQLAGDVLRLISPMRQYRTADPNYFIHQIDPAAMDASYPLPLIESGTPTRYGIVGQDAEGTYTVRFNRWGGTDPGDFVRIEYDYLIESSNLADTDTSFPLMPVEYRHIIVDWALVFLWADKNDDRRAEVAQVAARGLEAMRDENQKRMNSPAWGTMGRIVTRPSDWLRVQPLRTQSGLVIG